MIVVLSSGEFELSSSSVQFCPMLAGYAGFTQSDRVEIEGDDQLMMELIKFLQGNDFNMSEEVMEFFDYAGFPNIHGYPLQIFKYNLRSQLMCYLHSSNDTFNDDLIKYNNLGGFREVTSHTLDTYYTLGRLRPYFQRGDIIIAGGSCLGYITGTRFSDVDLFLICSEIRAREVIAILLKHYSVYAVSSNAITFSGPGLMIQVILRLFKNRSEVLRSFDLECCQVLFDGSDFYMTDYALHSIRTRELWFNPDLLSGRYASRLVKYALRGFKVQCPGYAPDIQFQGYDVVRALMYDYMDDDHHIHYYTSWLNMDNMTVQEHERTTPLVSESYNISKYVDVMISRLESISDMDLQHLKSDRDFIKKLAALLIPSRVWRGLTHEDITGTTNEELMVILAKFIARYVRHSDLFKYDPESIVMLSSKGIYINRSPIDDYSFISHPDDIIVGGLIIEGTKVSLYRSQECTQKNGEEIEFQGYTRSCITSNLGCEIVEDE
uniref:Uncharacterized protein n=1 Tax=viral metagenome TaxID=1070528 RepID=A0A6C0BL32_9ZZZZ